MENDGKIMENDGEMMENDGQIMTTDTTITTVTTVTAVTTNTNTNAAIITATGRRAATVGTQRPVFCAPCCYTCTGFRCSAGGGAERSVYHVCRVIIGPRISVPPPAVQSNGFSSQELPPAGRRGWVRGYVTVGGGGNRS